MTADLVAAAAALDSGRPSLVASGLLAWPPPLGCWPSVEQIMDRGAEPPRTTVVDEMAVKAFIRVMSDPTSALINGVVYTQVNDKWVLFSLIVIII